MSVVTSMSVEHKCYHTVNENNKSYQEVLQFNAIYLVAKREGHKSSAV